MVEEYKTSEEHLPDDTTGGVMLQVTDAESQEIFTARTRISRDPDDLSDPASLTVLKGPHENVEEQWYVEFVEDDVSAREIDETLLRDCLQESREESDLLNARSEELRAMLLYLVRAGEFESISNGLRSLLSAQLSAEYPELVERYVEVRTSVERESVASSLRGDKS